MKLLVKIFLLVLLPAFANAQDNFEHLPTKFQADSIERALQNAPDDTLKLVMCRELERFYLRQNKDTSFLFLEQGLALAQKLNQKLWEAQSLHNMSYFSLLSGDYPKAFKVLLEALKIAENESIEKNIFRVSNFSKELIPHKARLNVLASIYQKFSMVYDHIGNYDKSLESLLKSLKIAEKLDDRYRIFIINGTLAEIYINLHKLDSALLVAKKILDYTSDSSRFVFKGVALNEIGKIYFLKQNYVAAKKYYFDAVKANRVQNNLVAEPSTYLLLAELFRTTNQLDSSLFYAKKASEKTISSSISLRNEIYNSIYSTYKLQGKIDSAFKYLQMSKTLLDIENKNEIEKINQYHNLNLNEQTRLQEVEKEKIKIQNKIRVYSLLFGLSFFVLIGVVLYKNNRQKQKANTKLQNTLTQLKATQNQLIQSEKLASLGELTAGIAHEIQNPLNFVNNFSELSLGITKDLETEITNEPIDKDYVKELMHDLNSNQEKINHHGKRAASIVTGMIEHSKPNTGVRELTDINKLCDEYSRLSFNGLKAKNNDSKVEMITHFDESLPKIEIVPQDTGRVIVNLVNNAFYAVNERNNNAKNLVGFENLRGLITVTTQKIANAIEIRVKDNGIGMSEATKAKVFQPFFTTKPTGSGTGLGLSLAYDIITKGHGGTLEVESTEGEGTFFKVKLPS